jgi:hypothetical protein
MDSGTFKSAIYELSLYFERKLPGDETIRQWCEEVGNIPNKYARTLIAAAKQMESWPRNFPAWMRSKTVELKGQDGTDNPYKIHPRRFNPAAYAKGNCPDCGGKGLIDFHMDWPVGKEGTKVITKHVVKPALCPCTEAAEYGF